jgi:hypothetical protein
MGLRRRGGRIEDRVGCKILFGGEGLMKTMRGSDGVFDREILRGLWGGLKKRLEWEGAEEVTLEGIDAV